MKSKRLILCGTGNVGAAFLRLVAERAASLRQKHGLDLQVGAVVGSRGAVVAAEGGLPLPDLIIFLDQGGRPEDFPGFGQPGLTGVEVIRGGGLDALVETTPTDLQNGGPAAGFVRAAIARGLDVVSANKGPFVLFFAELQQSARASGSRLFISAATGAALPTLDVGKFSTAGADITAIEGILNGTTNFILTKMYHEKTSYADALREAQAMGIAETDPTLDVEGYDSRNKLVLIANTLLSAGAGVADVPVRGITQLTYEDIAEAAAAGQVLKLVATAEITDGQLALSVAPKCISASHPLATVNYSEKGITYTTDTMGQITVLGGKSSPQGAAAALLKDVIHSHLFSR